MARSAAVAVSSSRDQVDPAARDVARFHDFLQHGSPGPHGYAVLLGLDAFDAPELLRSITRGFPYRTLERFQRNTSLPLDRITDLVDIPRRTLTRRKGEGRFLPEESDRLLSASRLFGLALALFEGDRDAAADWLTRPQPALGGAVPLELAKTGLGTREVEALIGRLEHGVFP
jgi:putative toxin-antitoxin system antitoxin component (TIGR02293 family)